MSDPNDGYEMGKAILHHLLLDDRHPENGASKVRCMKEMYRDERGYAIMVKDLAPVLDMYVHLEDYGGDC